MIRQLLILVALMTVSCSEVPMPAVATNPTTANVDFYLVSGGEGGGVRVFGFSDNRKFFDGTGETQRTNNVDMTLICLLDSKIFPAWEKAGTTVKIKNLSYVDSIGNVSDVDFYLQSSQGSSHVVGFTNNYDFFRGMGTTNSNEFGEWNILAIFGEDVHQMMIESGATFVKLKSLRVKKSIS